MGQLWVTVDGDELANLTSGLDVAAAAVKDADERLEHAGATLARLGLTPEAGLATFDHLADAVVEARSCAGRLGLALSGRARSLRHALREYDGAERLPALLAAAAAVPGPQGWGVGLAGAALIGTESLLFSGRHPHARAVDRASYPGHGRGPVRRVVRPHDLAAPRSEPPG